MFTIVSIGIIFMVTSIVLGWDAGLPLSLLWFVGIIIYEVVSNAKVRIHDMHVGLVYNKETEAFVRLLSSGSRFIMPYREYVKATLTTGSLSSKGSKKFFTSDGSPVTLHWSASYKVDLMALSADMKKTLAIKLANYSDGIVKGRVEDALARQIATYQTADIFKGDTRIRIEEEAKKLISEELKNLSISAGRFKVTNIEVPAEVQKMLYAIENQTLQTQLEMKLLSQFEEQYPNLSDEYKRAIIDFVRLRTIGNNNIYSLHQVLTQHLHPNKKNNDSNFTPPPPNFSPPSGGNNDNPVG